MELRRDDFNSEIFKIGMGNVVEIGGVICEHEVLAMMEDATKKDIKHITVKVKTSEKNMVNTFLKEGFILADTLSEYVFDFKKSVLPNMDHKTKIRDCEEADLPYLMEIAKTSFEYDRFHSDQSLKNERCDKYYETWIYNSYHGFADKVIVSEYQGKAVGFTTGKIHNDNGYGRLVLSAVSDCCRGLGIYTSMIYEGVKWLQNYKELKGCIVGTQINNIAVQKAWIKLGFTVLSSEYVLQKYIGNEG